MPQEEQKKKISIAARIVKIPVRLYQIFISPVIHLVPGSGCRFHPSCSRYMIAAVETHGAFKGVCMGICRILRCNPFCRGGIDEVPKRFSWKKIFSQNDVDA